MTGFNLLMPTTWRHAQNGRDGSGGGDAWISVDKEKCRQIDAAIKHLKLQSGTKGYVFPASQCEKIVEIFSLLGRIKGSSSYDDFLSQLADFDQIGDVDLPASLRPAESSFALTKNRASTGLLSFIASA